MGRNHWWDKLNQVVGQLQGQEPAEKTALAMCAAFFRRAGQTQFAKEAYVKLQDHQVKNPRLSLQLDVVTCLHACPMSTHEDCCFRASVHAASTAKP